MLFSSGRNTDPRYSSNSCKEEPASENNQIVCKDDQSKDSQQEQKKSKKKRKKSKDSQKEGNIVQMKEKDSDSFRGMANVDMTCNVKEGIITSVIKSHNGHEESRKKKKKRKKDGMID